MAHNYEDENGIRRNGYNQTLVDKYGNDKTPYKYGVITKSKGFDNKPIYTLEVAKNKNDIFRQYGSDKKKENVKLFADRHNIKLYKDYREVHYSK